jgi:hypothetical protein
LTDTVEKVGRRRHARNNRIEEVCHSNQGCILDWLFESKLRGGTLKIFFQHYRPEAEINCAAQYQRPFSAPAAAGAVWWRAI